MNLTKEEARLLYRYSTKELYIEQDGGTLLGIFYVVCPCCGWHNIEEEDAENDNLEALIQHTTDCEFKEYKKVLNKLNEFLID